MRASYFALFLIAFLGLQFVDATIVFTLNTYNANGCNIGDIANSDTYNDGQCYTDSGISEQVVLTTDGVTGEYLSWGGPECSGTPDESTQFTNGTCYDYSDSNGNPLSLSYTWVDVVVPTDAPTTAPNSTTTGELTSTTGDDNSTTSSDSTTGGSFSTTGDANSTTTGGDFTSTGEFTSTSGGSSSNSTTTGALTGTTGSSTGSSNNTASATSTTAFSATTGDELTSTTSGSSKVVFSWVLVAAFALFLA